MSELLTTRLVRLPAPDDSGAMLRAVEASVAGQLAPDEVPIRLAVTRSDDKEWECEVDVHVCGGVGNGSIFQFEKRRVEDASSFNVVMLVPTGVGAEIGGHAGDAGPAAALIASTCDTMITHPNVLNGSDLIHIPQNTLYVEGSVIAAMLMGTVKLVPTLSNRLLVIVQAHRDRLFTDGAVNAVNAARAYYGLRAVELVEVDMGFKMKGAYGPSGSARGEVRGLEHIWEVLDARLGKFDAVALSSVIEIPRELHGDYYCNGVDVINPWGGVEAMLTHAISLKYGVPTAHSPMFESREIADMDVGVVDSRMAAEVVSLTFLQSVLRGLQRSPRIVGREAATSAGVDAEAVSCLVIPDGCLGLPTLAALYQGIRVIAVEENANVMRNNLAKLPWGDGQFIRVKNYWEAAGVIAALRLGLDPFAVRRPLSGVHQTPSQSEVNARHVPSRTAP